MSVLRKRSPWVVPAATLLLGALTLGIAGCGGDDDSGAPVVITPSVPVPTSNVNAKASTPTAVTAAGGGTGAVEVANAQNGTSKVRVTLPPGSVSQDVTLGVEPIDVNQSQVARGKANNPNAFVGIDPLFSFVVGAVDENGNLDPLRPITFAGNSVITITATPNARGQLTACLAQGKQIVVRKGGDFVGNITQQVRDFQGGNNVLELTVGNDNIGALLGTGEYTVTCEPTVHNQGGGR